MRASAHAAETLGYHSLWVYDRLEADRATPLDPLSTLTYAAALTERVRLGTSVLVGTWYPPALLARSLASLDLLSGRRLTVGLGLGRSSEELAAAGVEPRRSLAKQEELLDVLDATWGDQPRPPVLLAASTPGGLARVARRADGWNPIGMPVDALAPAFGTVRDLAAGHGRDPDSLALVVRAEVHLTVRPLGADRPSYHGDLDQVADDLDATRQAGAHEVILGVSGDRGLDATLDAYAALAEAIELRTPSPTMSPTTSATTSNLARSG